MTLMVMTMQKYSCTLVTAPFLLCLRNFEKICQRSARFALFKTFQNAIECFYFSLIYSFLHVLERFRTLFYAILIFRIKNSDVSTKICRFKSCIASVLSACKLAFCACRPRRHLSSRYNHAQALYIRTSHITCVHRYIKLYLCAAHS